jgi:hypothetical protein
LLCCKELYLLHIITTHHREETGGRERDRQTDRQTNRQTSSLGFGKYFSGLYPNGNGGVVHLNKMPGFLAENLILILNNCYKSFTTITAS